MASQMSEGDKLQLKEKALRAIRTADHRIEEQLAAGETPALGRDSLARALFFSGLMVDQASEDAMSMLEGRD